MPLVPLQVKRLLISSIIEREMEEFITLYLYPFVKPTTNVIHFVGERMLFFS